MSETMSSASMARSPRASITAIPWSPSVPGEHQPVAGPDQVRAQLRPVGITPTPAVEMYSPSAAPLETTFVSPVTICTPAASAAAFMSATIDLSRSISKPSSITNAAESHCGLAPLTARSLTVPCTAR